MGRWLSCTAKARIQSLLSGHHSLGIDDFYNCCSLTVLRNSQSVSTMYSWFISSLYRSVYVCLVLTDNLLT